MKWTEQQAEKEIRRTIRCHCDPVWTDRGRHSPHCEQEIVADWWWQILDLVTTEEPPAS